MSRQTFNTTDLMRLLVEKDPDPGTLRNYIPNPDGALGGYGYVTPQASTFVYAGSIGGQTTVGFRNEQASQTPTYFTTEFFAATPGEYVGARFDVAAIAAGHVIKPVIEFYDADRALLSSTPQAQGGSSGTVYIGWFQVPASTAYVKLRFNFYKVNAAGPDFFASLDIRHVMLTFTETATAVTWTRNLAPNPGFENTTGKGLQNWSAGANTYLPLQVAIFGTSDNAAAAPPITQGSRYLFAWPALQTSNLFPPSWSVNGPRVPVTAGQKVPVSLGMQWMYNQAFNTTGGITYRWYNASGAQIGADGTISATFTRNVWQRPGAVLTAPAGATALQVFPFMNRPGTTQTAGTGNDSSMNVDALLIEQGATVVNAYWDGNTADTTTFIYDWDGEEHVSTSTKQTRPTASFDYNDAVVYADVIGPSIQLSTSRPVLDVGTLTIQLVSDDLDPATSTLIRPGRRVLAQVLVGGTWQSIFTGTISNATVDYELLDRPGERAVITVTATDAASRLAKAGQPAGVGTLAELPYVLEGAGVPWNVNGSTDQIATAVVLATDDDASALDQVARTRDSVRGYVWIDRNGVLQAWDTAHISTTPKATLTDADYNGDLTSSYDTDALVNVVNVEVLSGTETTTHGPYTDSASVATWGVHSATYTVQGVTDPAAFAAAVLAANATPAVTFESATIPLLTPEDVAAWSTLDLYDLLTVTCADPALSLSLRITGISHTITPKKWLMTLSFGAVGKVSVPTEPLQVLTGGGGTPAGWIDMTPTSGTGTIRYQLKDGVVYGQVFLSGITSVAAGTAATLVAAANGIPAALRPGVSLYVGGNAGGVSDITGLFASDGSIVVLNHTGNAAITIARFSASWPLG